MKIRIFIFFSISVILCCLLYIYNLNKIKYNASNINSQIINSLEINEIKKIPFKFLGNLSKSEIKELKPQVINNFSPKQFSSIKAGLSLKQILNLKKNFIELLPVEIFNDIDFEEYEILTEDILNNLHPDLFYIISIYLKPKQITKLSEHLIQKIQPAFLLNLTDDEIHSLPDYFIKSLTKEQLNYIYAVLTDQQTAYVNQNS